MYVYGGVLANAMDGILLFYKMISKINLNKNNKNVIFFVNIHFADPSMKQ